MYRTYHNFYVTVGFKEKCKQNKRILNVNLNFDFIFVFKCFVVHPLKNNTLN